MKFLKFFYLMAVLVVLVPVTRAQKPIAVKSHTFSLTGKEYTGVTVSIPEVDYETVKKDWISLLEKGTKSKVKEAENGEISIFGAIIKPISKKSINVYSQLIRQDSLVQLVVSVELRRDHFLTEVNDPAEFNQLKSILFDFAKGKYIDAVKSVLRNEENKLQDIEKEQSNYADRKKQLESNIKEFEHNIMVSEDALAILNSDLGLINNDLSNLKVTLSTADNDLVKEDIEEKIKEKEKEKKKTLNSIEKENKNIAGNKSDIEEAKTEIEANVNQQKDKLLEIETQRSVVENIKMKLATIENF